MSTNSVNLRWALHYAGLGIPILRLRPGDKRLVDLGEQRTLEERATTDPAQITAWYEDERYTNIAQPMGRLSGTITFDIDSHEANEAFHVWRRKVHLPSTYEVVHSPRNFDSRHYRYALPVHDHDPTIDLPAIPSPTSFNGVKGFDIRADGSYTVLPPSSVYVSIPQAQPVASPYRWSEDIAKLQGGIQRVPCVQLTPEAVQSLQEWRQVAVTHLEDGSSLESPLPSYGEFLRRGFGWFTGSRNRDCWRLAWRFFAQANKGVHHSVHDVETLLRSVYDRTPQTPHPFPWHEAARTIRSAYDSYHRRRASEEEEMTQLSSLWTPHFDGDKDGDGGA